jgi:glycosyltransferase involved in cell wall biosynthesis
MKGMRLTTSVEPRKLVCLLMPGGLEHSGGIGRVMGYLVDCWSGDEAGPATLVFDTRGAGHIALAPFHFARVLATIVVLAVRGRLRILHLNLSSHGSTVRKAIVVALARVLGVKFIIHLHGSRFDVYYRGLRPAAKGVVRRMLLHAERVIVLGRYWENFVASEVGVPQDRIATVFNGVPDPGPRLIEERKKRAESSDRPPHILFLGRLGERKGVPELISALDALAREGKPWRATLAGDGAVDRYRDEVRRLGLEQRIIVPGWVDRRAVDELLREADVVVLPSYQENQPMSVIEGLAHGIAVVTTPVGALPDILDDGKNSLIVSPGDVPALATALRRLIDDPRLRGEIADQGRETFSRRLDVRLAAGRLAEIYDEIENRRS